MRKRISALVLVFILALSAAASGTALAAPADSRILNNDGRPMTLRALTAQLNLEDDARAELERDGVLLGQDDLAATGQFLRIIREDGTVSSVEQVIVIGDVIGTGEAGIGQVTRIAQSLSGGASLNGIYAIAGDINGSGGVDLTDLLLAVQQMHSLAEAESKTITVEQRNIYGMKDEPTDPISIEFAFVDGHMEIPYLPASSLPDFINSLLQDAKRVTATSSDVSAEIVTFQVPNGSIAEFNFVDGTICFTDYNQFFKASYASSVLDLLSENASQDGTAKYIRRLPESFERSGKTILLELRQYDIDMFYKDGMGYIPAQTVMDIFGAGCTVACAYNGEAYFWTSALSTSPELTDMFYSVSPRDRSQELADYSYNELCLVLDMYYGLKEQHNIQKFNALFLETGLSEQLRSTDPVTADNAIAEVCYAYFADIHSSFTAASPYAGRDAEITQSSAYPAFANYVSEVVKMQLAFLIANPDGASPYQEVGNTAYVMLSSFTWDPQREIDVNALTPNPEDTLELIMYAHQQITREDSPIENVVLDLSSNLGGAVDAAAYVIGWFLGGKAQISVNDTLTEAQGTTYYEVDVNGDGVFDENDTVASKNLYCLVAAPSFSCGNLVPATFKASNEVTLLGKQTGGGACSVMNVATATGTRFTISSNNRISTVANGSYYDVDRGVVPDIPIVKVENFYDREALTEFINGLYR